MFYREAMNDEQMEAVAQSQSLVQEILKRKNSHFAVILEGGGGEL
jgi:hypothetical protein